MPNSASFRLLNYSTFNFMAGLPALHSSESGQVRKEAATAIFCKCRGSGSPPFLFAQVDDLDGIGIKPVLFHLNIVSRTDPAFLPAFNFSLS
jgi:hypothetical protein